MTSARRVDERMTRSGDTDRPFAEHATRSANRRSRVSGFFALVTQKPAVRRYQGGCARNHAQARAFFRNRASSARPRPRRFSYESRGVFFGSRAS